MDPNEVSKMELRSDEGLIRVKFITHTYRYKDTYIQDNNTNKHVNSFKVICSRR